MDDIGDQLNYLQSDVEVRNNKESNGSAVKIISNGGNDLSF